MQLALDTTLVSPVRADGTARPGAAQRDGVALVSPELVGRGARARLVVLAGEVGGRWSGETSKFLRLLAAAKARPERFVDALNSQTFGSFFFFFEKRQMTLVPNLKYFVLRQVQCGACESWTSSFFAPALWSSKGNCRIKKFASVCVRPSALGRWRRCFHNTERNVWVYWVGVQRIHVLF